MKRLRLAFMLFAVLAAVLWAGSASGETVCPHEETALLASTSEYENVTEGHLMVDTTVSICSSCGEKLVKRSYGKLQGHVFLKALSIHFDEDKLHLCAFLCTECGQVTKVEYPCGGGRQCFIYQGGYGNEPPVQHVERREGWDEDGALAALAASVKDSDQAP